MKGYQPAKKAGSFTQLQRLIGQNHRQETQKRRDIMILACHGLCKSFGENVIVTEGSFHIEDHEKAALVGPNGAGKTTLFKMIVGELPTDGGEIVLTKDRKSTRLNSSHIH